MTMAFKDLYENGNEDDKVNAPKLASEAVKAVYLVMGENDCIVFNLPRNVTHSMHVG